MDWFYLILWIILGGTFSLLPYEGYSLFGSFEYLNPLFLYDYHSNLNWFGVICLALLYNLICPLVTIAYWFYKLCTVGRR